jgi:hypothetical protein
MVTIENNVINIKQLCVINCDNYSTSNTCIAFEKEGKRQGSNQARRTTRTTMVKNRILLVILQRIKEGRRTTTR